MSNKIIRMGAVAVGLIGPPAITHMLNTQAPDRPVSIFMVLLLEVLGFTLLAAVLRPQRSRTLIAALVYFPLTFVVTFWIGYLAGHYDLP